MRKHQVADEAQGFVLDAKYQQFEWAKRALEQARLELGGVIANVGLSASAHRIARSRQWCLQVVQAAEERAREDARRRDGDQAKSPLPDVSDLIESVRRSGILEPLVVGVVDDDTLRVVDGHRRLRAAREAGVTSLPVMLSLIASDAADELRAPAEEAARSHRRVTFRYARPDGVEAMRTVDVWGLVRRAEHLYLIGYDQDREAPRTFRLSRIVGGITFVGSGTPPPEGFSAEASVWGPLDPESLEALEESFRRVLKEQRASAEDDGRTGGAAAEDERTQTLAEADQLRQEVRGLVERISTEVGKMKETVLLSKRKLTFAVEAPDKGLGAIEMARHTLDLLLHAQGEWQSQLESVLRGMTDVDDRARQRVLSRWRALDAADE